MPFFLANPRMSGTTQQGRLDRVDYQRSAPSQVMVFVQRVVDSAVDRIYQYLPTISKLAITNDDGWHRGPFDNMWLPMEYPVSNCFPIKPPAVCLAFNGRPSTEHEEMIEAMGATVDRIPGNKGDVYLIAHPTYDHYKEIMGLPNLKEIRPVRGYITAHQIFDYIRMLVTTSATANVIMEAMIPHPDGQSITVDTDVSLENSDVKQTTDPKGKGKAVSKDVEMTEVPAETVEDEIRVDQKRFHKQTSYWSNLESFVDKATGILIPFEPNYSQTDYQGFAVFTRLMHGFFGNDAKEQASAFSAYGASWVGGIAATDAGERLAHIWKVMEMARDAGTYAHFIFRPEHHYEGAILVGEGVEVRRLGSGTFVGANNTVLREELERFGFHSANIMKIAVAMGLTAQMGEMTSMRRLRELVMVGKGPDMTQKQVLKPLIEKLSFGEKPTPVNTSTIDNTLSYFESDMVLPHDWFLPAKYFWEEDRAMLILARFGERAPTFFTGDQKTMMTPTMGKNSGKSLRFRKEGPQFLQAKMIPVGSARVHWLSMVEGGWIMASKNVANGGRLFRGPEKVKLLGVMERRLSATVLKAIGTPDALAEVPTGERKRALDDDTDERETKRAEITW